MEHLKYVLNKLYENNFFANKVKNEFDQEELDFLKHILLREGVRPNSRKLQAIRNMNMILPRLG